MTLAKTEKWHIWIQGYGEFEFDGTEAEAEDMRRHKSEWEGGKGMKYRADTSTEVDRITKQIVDLWDDGEGVPQSLFTKLKAAKEELGI